MNKEEANTQYNYKTRMIDELIWLTEKITLLGKALDTDDSKIEKEKRELMYKQLDHMYCYRSVLIDRIFIELQ